MSEFDRHGDLNIQVGINTHGHGHNRFDPITQEARQIAQQMDCARNMQEAQMAAERLREDVSEIRNPREQRRLVDEVNRFDNKGVGADLYLGQRGGPNDCWNEISVMPPGYTQGLPPGYRPGNYPGEPAPPYYPATRPGNYPNPQYGGYPPNYPGNYPGNYPVEGVPPYYPPRSGGVNIGAEIHTHGITIDVGIFKRLFER